MKKTLILGLPSGFHEPYIFHEKVFEFLQYTDVKYLKDYQILYRSDLPSSRHIEELIEKWDLDYKAFYPTKENPTNYDRMLVIKDMVEEGKNGDAFIVHYPHREDMGNKILLDHCDNEFGIYLKTCKINLDYSIS